jgi:peptide/nickel transport system substrate-binding protein
LNSYDIVGLNAYRTQTPDDLYTKFDAIVNAIYAAGADHTWAEGDAFTKDQQDAFWAGLKTAWTEDVQDIVNYVVTSYNTDEYAAKIGSTPAEITEKPGLQIALGMAMWNFGKFADGVLTSGDASWNLAGGEYPTIDDYYAATFAAYQGDSEAFFGTEAVDAKAQSPKATAAAAFIQEQAKTEPEAAAGVPNIAGIKKLDNYTVQITMNGFSAPAIYQVFGISITPLHYYGDKALYDYENNKFGFPFGDTSSVEAKTGAPLGAGPYKFVSYENKVVYLEANDKYYKGAPKIKNIQLTETSEPDKVPGIISGAIDIANPSFSTDNIDSIKKANGGELNGPVLHSVLVDNLGYGYVGVSATNVKVGEEPGSDASKDLRTALMTALALYRDVACDSYYGEIATVINYPISNTSWAAPQKTDADYKVAFSTDIDGKDIYTADMTMAQKEEAALAAIIGYLKAAGYTYDEASGMFTAAPEGAAMEYEVAFGTDGKGDHPSIALVTDAKALLAKVGITLTINDTSFDNLINKTKSGNAQFFCLAWGATPDPDMYQVYHSSNVIGAGGTDSNQYMLADPQLDQLILDARSSADQSYRKATYKAALDIIIDWAVELPFYQRQNAITFSSERVNLDTLPKDSSTYYGYGFELHNLELK